MAFMEKQHWEEAINVEMQCSGITPFVPPPNKNLNDLTEDNSAYFCLVDASWVSTSHRAGIGWSLHSKEGIQLLVGSASIPSTQTALQAEAMALLMAVQHLQALGYTHITLVGDCKVLYEILQQHNRGFQRPAISHASIATLIQDILALAIPVSFCFQYAPRCFLQEADKLAKTARQHGTEYCIKWIL
ncbi:unnamed protein product [Thlaspi arvense]|uniref:RNase H type-1 domain-containing protein n=1 Tax=Thlaspi arvense TaxID=13288 RepID=A0AAU9RP05_THLAR|nr:unnamed protein product [Thlaspi arvense]